MPSINLRLVDVRLTLELPAHLAAKVTKEDLAEMANKIIGTHQTGLGVQAIVETKAQWTDMGPDYAKSDPVFADVFVDGCWEEDVDIDSCDDEFVALLDANPDICS